MSSDSARQHLQHAGRHVPSVNCALLTISDSRTTETDSSGDTIHQLLTDAGHPVVARSLVRDEPDHIQQQIGDWLDNDDIHVIITTGGTGISRRDGTVEIIRRTFTTEIEGFGELFRSISYQQIGAAAMMSRACAGLVARTPETGGDTFIFALPGSQNAVRTAMESLILNQLAHLVWERKR